MEDVSYPPFRVITFGSFSLNRLHLHAQSSKEPSFYEPIAEKVWRSRTAACSLLKLLLCRTRRRAPRDLLIEALWPAAPMSNANHNLDTAMSLLRNLLRPEGKESLLTTIHSGITTIYQLPSQQQLWADVDEFLAQVTLAEQVEEQGGNPQPYFEMAWQIGSDIFLEDDLYCEWAQARRQTINATRHRVLHRLVDCYVHTNKHYHAEKLLLKASEEEPTNEDALYRLMETLDWQKRRQEALQIYRQTTDFLREEQEIKPGVQLQELARRFSTEPSIPAQLSTPSRAERRIQSVIFSPSPIQLAYISPIMLEHLHPTDKEQTLHQQSLSGDISPLLTLKNVISNEMLLYRIIKEICCWTSQEDADEILQANIDRLIRSNDTMEQHDTSKKVFISRRDVVTLIAGLPAILLTYDAQDQLNTVQTEEFLAQCAASIAAC